MRRTSRHIETFAPRQPNELAAAISMLRDTQRLLNMMRVCGGVRVCVGAARGSLVWCSVGLCVDGALARWDIASVGR